jgi:4-alpha-glucanotransferase
MNFPRASGVLLHITSLPGDYGIGDLGNEAFQFVDFLLDTGQKLWQILPLVPPGYDNSPYSGTSVFAGNPLLISLDKLLEEGLLNFDDLKDKPAFNDNRVNYNAVSTFKNRILRKAFLNFYNLGNRELTVGYEDFLRRHKNWLDKYAMFTTIREENNYIPWNQWEHGLKSCNKDSLNNYKEKFESSINFHKFVQFIFYRQWSRLKQYCNGKGISIIGDMPFYVYLDSDTVWSNPELFEIDNNYQPLFVAGVPPDYFSKDGQLWGNPLYKWDIMKQNGYSWWLDRFRSIMSRVDIIRIDHFRGFQNYWEIPADAATAETGKWRHGPGLELFQAVENKLGELPVIAEDLGIITPDVTTLREQLGFPGMKVLQFAFSDDSGDNPHLPDNYPVSCVAYTGTHDNDTTIGWFNNTVNHSTMTEEEIEAERKRIIAYTGTDGSHIEIDFMRLCLSSVANTAIIPMQDVLGLGSEARMNIPGKPHGNWEWRFTFDQLTKEKKDTLSELTVASGR